MTKSDSPDPVVTGTELTYTIVAKNKGPAKAAGVQVTDTLPASVTWKSTATTKGTCSGTSTLTCSLGELAKNQSATITVKVTPNTPGSINNSVMIRGDQSDPQFANNQDSEPTTVNSPNPPPPPPPPPPPGSEMTLSVTDSPDPVRAGERLTYVARWENVSGRTLDRAALSLFIGEGPKVIIESVEATQGFCSSTQWTGPSAYAGCSLGRVEVGAKGTVTVVVRPLPSLDGTNYSLTTTTTLVDSNCDSGDPREDPISWLLDVNDGCQPASRDLAPRVTITTTVNSSLT